ncbi:type-F conjugative transfer system protein TrbI [Providencia rettgeri]|nr:type-F conjugative transfer system protein TrbI [Providencia sp. PROV223]MCY0801955.1 type-F conjugative transfer system protein TrbI [Providencia rettgeri]
MSFFMVIAVVLSFSISVFVVRWLAPVTVTFDMTGTVNQYQQQMAMQFNAETPLSEQQIADATHRFQMALSDSLSEYQQTHQALILVTPAVVMGAEDITVDIQAAIADKMAQ